MRAAMAPTGTLMMEPPAIRGAVGAEVERGRNEPGWYGEDSGEGGEETHAGGGEPAAASGSDADRVENRQFGLRLAAGEGGDEADDREGDGQAEAEDGEGDQAFVAAVAVFGRGPDLRTRADCAQGCGMGAGQVALVDRATEIEDHRERGGVGEAEAAGEVRRDSQDTEHADRAGVDVHGR